MTPDERERLAILEVQMEKLMGNGQPGMIDHIWRELKSHSRQLNIGYGVVITLQVVTGLMVALIAGGVIKIR